MRRWIVAYDVSDDRRRTRLAERLSRHGVRQQRSVFECLVDDERLDQVVAEAQRLIPPGHDRLDAFAQCQDCAALRRFLGPRPTVLEARFYIV
jgi:CRISPR-associated protein Cas2